VTNRHSAPPSAGMVCCRWLVKDGEGDRDGEVDILEQEAGLRRLGNVVARGLPLVSEKIVLALLDMLELELAEDGDGR